MITLDSLSAEAVFFFLIKLACLHQWLDKTSTDIFRLSDLRFNTGFHSTLFYLTPGTSMPTGHQDSHKQQEDIYKDNNNNNNTKICHCKVTFHLKCTTLKKIYIAFTVNISHYSKSQPRHSLQLIVTYRGILCDFSSYYCCPNQIIQYIVVQRLWPQLCFHLGSWKTEILSMSVNHTDLSPVSNGEDNITPLRLLLCIAFASRHK